ncbi:peroxiredoxin family protein [Spongiimicrobium salis]|uniref:peroxiredoxin family protein n=1 Tax=Spongiimicrobium salis TaxID=1667022 RepID=UPI00374D258D
MRNRLHSIFISFFPILSLFIMFYSLILYFMYGFLGSAGMFLSAMTIASLFMGFYIKTKTILKLNLNIFTFLVSIGCILSFISFLSSEDVGKTSLIISSLLLVGWFFYLRWYSVFMNRESELLKIGKTVPEFKVMDTKGKSVSSRSFKGKVSIYIFYRGNWCPICVSQIEEIAGLYKDLEKRNVHTVLISPQPQKQTLIMAKKIDIGFHFLVDEDNKAAQQLGIAANYGVPFGFQFLGYDSDTVLPTVFITDEEGRILYRDLTNNYRLRPKPETFLDVIDTHYVKQKKVRSI